MMKKILYFLPAIVFGLVYLLLIVENAGSIEPHGWFILALMIVSGILLAKNKWWAAIPGVCIGIFFIYSGLTNEYMILPEWQTGIALVLYNICKTVGYAYNNFSYRIPRLVPSIDRTQILLQTPYTLNSFVPIACMCFGYNKYCIGSFFDMT